mgnify:CR=1 FL=1
MSFLIHAIAPVSHRLICDTTLLFPSCLSLWVSKIQMLSDHLIAYFISFASPILTLKSDIIRRIYELFDACDHPFLSLPHLWHNFTFSLMSLGLGVKIQFLSEHIISYFVSFDSPIWTLKSDMIQPRYEVFDSHGRSCLALPLFVTQIYFFLHVSRPKLQNLDFFRPYHSLLC